MKEFVLKNNTTGLYFVENSGFTAQTPQEATRLTAETVSCVGQCAAKMGFGNTSSEAAPNKVSYAVVYIRKGDQVSLTGVTKQPGSITLNQLDPSKRRFASRHEANVHAGRFYTRRANKTDLVGSGTAGHVGVFVIETTDPVNSYVNPASGLTNSLKG